MEGHVKSPAFDNDYAAWSRKAQEHVSVFDESDSDYEANIGPTRTTVPRPVFRSRDQPPRIATHLYYAGIVGNGCGPKLIYRTSDDNFVEPDGPEAYYQAHRRWETPHP